MKARPEVRDRPATEVAVLDALVERPEEGLSVLELRAQTDVDIDDLEEALSNLKRDGLIEAREAGGRTLLIVDERAVPDGNEAGPEPSPLDRLRERLGLP